MTAPISGHRAKQAREAVRLTQRKLAELLDVSDGLISAWEGGRSSPPPWRIPLYAHVLGVEPHELFDPGTVLEDGDLGLLRPEQIVEVAQVTEPIEIRVADEPELKTAARGPKQTPRVSSKISPATGVPLDYGFANRVRGSSITKARRQAGTLPDWS